MSCTIKYQAPKNNSQLATKNFLVAKTIIDKFNKILDFTKWSNEAGRLNNIAKRDYQIKENILSSEQQGKIAYFNKPMFDEIDKQKNNQLSKKQILKNTIEKDLPIEISKAITVVDEVPLNILGRNDLFLSLKDILTENGVKDELLINWVGINKDKVDINPNIIHYDKAIETIIQKVYNKKKIESNYIEFKTNKLAKESFYKWIEALEKYPIAFQDAMLTHALKWLNNPQRREKYVLQLSKVALQNAYGMVVNKPHELNRIGKLYDKEVLSVVSDAVKHEPSASGKGYWVHVPRTSSNDKEQYKVNVDLLRKLSPSTWCTSGSLTEHYVQNYDNYLLIIDGITVAGIEAYPEENDEKTLKDKISKLEQSYENGDGNYESYKRIQELKKQLNGEKPKIKVKEVTSRNNNGTASIDHLDDTIAFFEKHNLDLDNTSLKLAIKNKNLEKTDNDFEREELLFIWDDFVDEEEDRGDVDDPGLEYRRQAGEDYDMAIAENMNLEEALNAIGLGGYIPGHYFRLLSQEIQNNEQVVRYAIDFDPHNIMFVTPNLPFYNEVLLIAIRNNPAVYNYLTQEIQNLPEVREIYTNYLRERNNFVNDVWTDDLPFSKTTNKLIQGYYDSFKDKVVIVANNTPVNEVSKIALHEVAHRGIVRMAKDLGGTKELNQILLNSEKELMKKLPELLKRTGHKNIEDLILDYGFNINTEEGKIKLLIELAARWAETFHNKIKPSWWKEFLQSIQKWISKFTGKILNENEVNELVGGFVKYGTQNTTQQPIKEGVEKVFESNFPIFAGSKTSDEVISKLLSNKIIDKKCN